MPCFWCNRQTYMTRDHVIPVCAGGEDYNGNVVLACRRCNDERGRISQLGRMIELFLDKFDTAVFPTIGLAQFDLDVLVRRRDEILKLQKKWVAIELRILGFSPSSEFCIDIPSRIEC